MPSVRSAVGDPGSDLRILASLPASMVSEAATLCRLGDGRRFTPVEATQVGLVGVGAPCQPSSGACT